MRRCCLRGALLRGGWERGARAAPPAPRAPPAPPERIREQEPNDFQHAQQIPARAVVTGSLQAPRDDDWYRVGAAGGKTLALRIEVNPVAGAPLEAYDRARNRLLPVPAGRGGPGVGAARCCR